MHIYKILAVKKEKQWFDIFSRPIYFDVTDVIFFVFNDQQQKKNK